MPNIVQVNVSLQEAPTPSTLQGTGALLSQGGTNTSPGTLTLLTQQDSITPFLASSKAISSITSVSGVATATTASPHSLPVGLTIPLVIAGASPDGYNGSVEATITSTTEFTYPVLDGLTSPATGSPTFIPQSGVELKQMVSTFFGQNSNTSIYVLELGAGDVDAGVTFLSSWIDENPATIYSYLVPRVWDADDSFVAFLERFESTTAKTYFWVTTTLATYKTYTPLMKCVVALIEAPKFGAWATNPLSAISWSQGVVTATTSNPHGVQPGQWFQIGGVTPSGYNGWFLAQPGTEGSNLVFNLPSNPGAQSVLGTLVASHYASDGTPATEFSMAAPLNVALSMNPSAMVPPFAFSFLFNVTPFATRGNSALLDTLAAANISVVGTGAEGGISNAILLYGHTLDGNAFNFWYAIDWAAINVELSLANAVINGSNSDVAPLYLNQPGINTLQGVAASVLNAGISAGLLFGSLVQTELSAPAFAAAVAAGKYNGYVAINAVPFATYYNQNPGDYKIRRYSGFSVSAAPQNGFENIVFNIAATQFVA